MTQRRVYRSSEQMLLMIAISLALGVFACHELAVLWDRGQFLGSAGTLPLFALAWFIIFRCGRASVYVTVDGVNILNPSKTVHVRWEAIREFSIRSHGFWPEIGVAELYDGLRSRGRIAQPRAQRVVDSPGSVNSVLEDLIYRFTDAFPTQ